MRESRQDFFALNESFREQERTEGQQHNSKENKFERTRVTTEVSLNSSEESVNAMGIQGGGKKWR